MSPTKSLPVKQVRPDVSTGDPQEEDLDDSLLIREVNTIVQHSYNRIRVVFDGKDPIPFS